MSHPFLGFGMAQAYKGFQIVYSHIDQQPIVFKRVTKKHHPNNGTAVKKHTIASNRINDGKPCVY
jgi:hypothetical protein